MLLASAGATHADIPAADLERVVQLAQTLQLEAQAADALRRKDGQALKQLAADIRKADARLLASMDKLARERRLNTDLALQLGPCHYAGMSIRFIIVGLADGRLMPRIKPGFVDMRPPDLSDRFASEVRRCEFLERVEPSTRKIGSSCLIDGKGCRERER